MAMRRRPSKIDPGKWGGRPFSYMETVQPIWDKHCVSCHGAKDPDGGIDLSATPTAAYVKSYESLTKDVSFRGFDCNLENAAKALVPRYGMRNQVQVAPPGGAFGARGSRLIKLLRDGHEGVELTPEELGRVGTWIDMNAIFYGVYLPEEQARQRKVRTRRDAGDSVTRRPDRSRRRTGRNQKGTASFRALDREARSAFIRSRKRTPRSTAVPVATSLTRTRHRPGVALYPMKNSCEVSPASAMTFRASSRRGLPSGSNSSMWKTCVVGFEASAVRTLGRDPGAARQRFASYVNPADFIG